MNKLLKSLTIPAFLLCPAIYAQEKPLQLTFSSSSGSVQFRAIGHPSALHVVGKGSGPEGTATVNKESASADLSFVLSTLDTGIEVRDRHMKEKYLETDKYPKALLVITKFSLPESFSQGAFSFKGAPFIGILTLHGTSTPVSGTVDLKWDGAAVVSMSSQFSIKLTQFGIQLPSFSGITIADEVQITVTSQPQIVK